MAFADRIILSWGWGRRGLAFAAGACGALAMAPFDLFPAFFIPMVVAVWLIDGSGQAIKGEGWPNAALIRAMLDAARPRKSGSYGDLIALVKDRPGHDRRYAMDASKIERELGWRPRENFESGMRKTLDWYLGRGAAA